MHLSIALWWEKNKKKKVGDLHCNSENENVILFCLFEQQRETSIAILKTRTWMSYIFQEVQFQDLLKVVQSTEKNQKRVKERYQTVPKYIDMSHKIKKFSYITKLNDLT